MKIKKNDYVLLIYPKTGPTIAEPPYSLLYIGSWLEKSGVSAIIIDGRFSSFDHIAKTIKENGPPVFCGLSTMTGPQIHGALAIAQFIRNLNPDIPLVWGGIHPTIDPENTISHPLVDAVVIGHGEEISLELYYLYSKCQGKKGAGKHNLSLQEASVSGKQNFPVQEVKLSEKQVFHEKKRVPLNSLRPLHWHLIKPQRYIDKKSLGLPAFYLFTSRGCNYRCSFCYSHTVHSRWEGLCSELVLEEVDKIKKLLPKIQAIIFHDDNFSCDKNRLEEICIGMKKRGLGYVLSSHPGDIDREIVKFHKECGCLRLDFAVESGSERIMQAYGKGISRRAAKDAFNQCKRQKLPIYVSFMAGHPLEKNKDISATMNMMDEIMKDSEIARVSDIKLLTPYPGTPVFSEAKKWGFKPPASLEGWSYLYWNNILLPWVKNKGLLQRISFASLLAFCDYRIGEGMSMPMSFVRPFSRAAHFYWKKRDFNSFYIHLGTMALYLYFHLIRYAEKIDIKAILSCFLK